VLAILGFTKVPTRAIGYTGAMLRGYTLGVYAKSSPGRQGRSAARVPHLATRLDMRGTELGHRILQANQLSAAPGGPASPELGSTFCRCKH